MTTSQKILEELQAKKATEDQLTFGFAAKRPERPYRAMADTPGGVLTVCVEDFDRLGLLVTEIRAESGMAGDLDAQISLAVGLSPLPNPLELVEIERDESHAVLRTSPIGKTPPQYLELTLDGCVAVLTYFRVESPKERRVTPVNMSVAAFEKLIECVVQMMSA